MKRPRLRRLRSLAGLSLLAILLLIVTGCVQSDSEENRIYSDPAAAADLDLPENPRVVALGWSDGEIALSLGVAPVAIYDWMGFGPDGKGVGSWISGEFGDETPEIISAASAGDFNYQQIEEFEPDLILNVRAKADSKVTERLAQIAPVVAAPDGTADYAVNWKVQSELIGNALGRSDEAQEQIDQTVALQDRIREAHPEFAGKTFVWGAKFGEAYGAYTAGDARFDTFAELGFVLYPPVEQLTSQGFFASVPAEQVSALDAQVAVFTPIGMPFTALQEDPLLNTLPVVRDGRAIEMAEDDPVAQAVSAGTPASLRYALEALEPRLVEAVGRL